MVFLFQSFITSLCTALCATLGLISICPHITCGEYIQIHYATGVLTTLVPLVHCGATKFQTRFLITAFDWHFSSPRDALLPASQVAVCFCLLVCFFILFIYTEIVPVTLPRIGTFSVLSSPTSVPFLRLRRYFSHSIFNSASFHALHRLCCVHNPTTDT